MKLVHKLSFVALVAATLLVVGNTAKAQTARHLFNAVKNLQSHMQGGGRFHPQPRPNPGHGRPDWGPGHCPPSRPGYCPPTRPGYCPPTRPVHVYLVYYRDCHGHWQFYGRFYSRHQAYAAAERLRYQGYQTYVRTGRGAGGGVYPASPGNPVPGPSFPR